MDASLRQISPSDAEVRHEAEVVFGRADRRRAEASRVRHGGSGHCPTGGDFGANALPLEEAVRGVVVGSGARSAAHSTIAASMTRMTICAYPGYYQIGASTCCSNRTVGRLARSKMYRLALRAHHCKARIDLGEQVNQPIYSRPILFWVVDMNAMQHGTKDLQISIESARSSS